MAISRLEIGRVYYSCYVSSVDDLSPERLIVSSWIYEGTVSDVRTKTSCDEPFRFYKFSEFESWIESRGHGGTGAPKIRLIPSMKQVAESMLGLDELNETLKCFEIESVLNDVAAKEPSSCSYCDEQSSPTGVMMMGDEVTFICGACIDLLKTRLKE